jgi:TolA-binding protein
MKSIERHKLKENEFARTVAHTREVLEAQKRTITMALTALVVVLAGIGGYVWWRQARDSGANEMLASAIAVYDAPVVPITAPAPGSPAPLPQAGTFPTEQGSGRCPSSGGRRYPNSTPGLVAKYHLAGVLAALGQYPEAEQRFQEVVSKGTGSIYARTARLGLAEAQVAQGKYDNAIQIYTELSRDTSSQMPVDGVLMQLGRAYARAGRKEEAARTFDRIVQEFPQSSYLSEAQRELEAARKS